MSIKLFDLISFVRFVYDHYTCLLIVNLTYTLIIYVNKRVC